MKTIFVTNIPTPYRVSMYNRLNEIAIRDGKQFSVYFMNEIEPNRSWVIDEPSSFESKIWGLRMFEWRGFYVRFGLHFVASAIKHGDHLVLGGSWNDLNVMLISVLKRLGLIRNKISFWTEANHLTVGAAKSSRLKYQLRRFILNSADGFYFVPGKMSEISLKKWGVNIDGKLVGLPNLPHARFDQLKARNPVIGGSLPVFTIVARLHEETKGLLNFLQAIGASRVAKIKLNIIGSGPDRDLYEEYINSHNLQNSVMFFGELRPELLFDVLSRSDALVLPSFSDPSPLTLVEACKLGLPVLVSNRCGNHYECVEEGKNGFLFDPFNPETIQNAFDCLLNNQMAWPSFSKKSRDLAGKNFNTNQVLERLSDKL